ncbi:universal stress protein [Sphingorhabdus lutea]|uniref:Universal stress protein n=1 Tax=Sphingorhabdus lutea TaxID=1913578 RepID=A0A1L3JC20_9SPHN|nr:universal stress protein [Sphingorhabdus lutea]APG62676.1 universal stress protein [Sphingorhabdus lutea]
MRVYLVVIDDTEEAKLALRFSARRAAKTGGAVHILTLVEPTAHIPWGGVQATLEDEAQIRAEELVANAAGELFDEMGVRPRITVRAGNGVKIVRDLIKENADISALVLGTAASGNPGPLVSHFAGTNAGTLPCPIILIPGSLGRDDIDRIS